MYKKNIILFTIFLLITFLGILKYEQIIREKYGLENKLSFYNEKNNIDMFILGTSLVYWTLSPMEIWNKYGIVSYNNGSLRQHYIMSYIMLEDIFRRHKPKVILMDTTYLIDSSLYKISYNDMLLASLKNDVFKIKAYLKMYNNQNIEDIFKHMDNILPYHTRWKVLNKYDFINENYWKGQLVHENAFNKVSFVKYDNNTINAIKLKDETIKYANMMIDLAKRNNANIVFIRMPNQGTDKTISEDKAFTILAKQNKWDYIDYNELFYELNFDTKNDFTDTMHMNVYGARKVMDHLIPYIINKYHINDKSNDPLYMSWNNDYKLYSLALNNKEIKQVKSFTEWSKLTFNNNYIILLATKYGVIRHIPETILTYLSNFHLSKYITTKANQKYASIIENNNIFYENISDISVNYKGKVDKKINIYLESSEGNTSIKVNGKEHSKNKYGINIVVYDKINKQVVDSVWIDPNYPDEIKR